MDRAPAGFLLIPQEIERPELVKSGPEEVEKYETLTYTFVIANPLDGDVEVVLTDPLPEGAEFDPAVPQEYPWTLSDGVPSTIVGLGVGETAEIKLRLRATGEAGTVITNADFAYAVGAGEPVVDAGTVQTEILPVSPVDVDLGTEDRCVIMEKGEYAVFEPDLGGIGAAVTRVDYYVGIEILESVTAAFRIRVAEHAARRPSGSLYRGLERHTGLRIGSNRDSFGRPLGI